MSNGPASTSEPEPTPVEEASPPPSSRDAEVLDDEHTENAVETTPKTFKDLVCIGSSLLIDYKSDCLNRASSTHSPKHAPH